MIMESSDKQPSTPELQDFFNFSMIFDDNYVQFEQFGIFFKSIDWEEPWLIGLIFFHVAVTLLSFLCRRQATAQGCLFLFMLTLIVVSEKLNQMAAENWKLFSRHQYFDSNGMFISIVFSLPLLFNCMIIVVNWLMISSELMTSIRKFQLQQRNEKIKVKNKRSINSSCAHVASGSKDDKKKEEKQD